MIVSNNEWYLDCVSYCAGKIGSLKWAWSSAVIHPPKCKRSRRWIDKKVAEAFCVSLYIWSIWFCYRLERAASLTVKNIKLKITYSLLFIQAFLNLQKNDIVEFFEDFVFVYLQFVVEKLLVNFLLDIFRSGRSDTWTCSGDLPLYVSRDILTWVKCVSRRLYPVSLVWNLWLLIAVLAVLESFLHRVK